MKLKDIKVGERYVEELGGDTVRVISIRATKHYGPDRCVRIRYPDSTTEFVAPEDLQPLPDGKATEGVMSILMKKRGKK